MQNRLQHLRHQDYRSMPWKNGGGTTTEIYVCPLASGPGLPADGFLWRVSMARIEATGPFSAFPGYMRIIMQVDGPRLQLAHGAHGAHALTALVPYQFAGDWPTTCTFADQGAKGLAAPAHDFNLIMRQGSGAAHVEYLPLKDGQARKRPVHSAALFYALTGPVLVRRGDDLVRLSTGDSCLVMVSGEIELSAIAEGKAQQEAKVIHVAMALA